ncbi:nucleotide exchange factor GrpE [Leucobacter chromiiresistens]|uniref:Protein GrpE n=1 Tax=Leucobacter chromiiresistens TaxID=1079994 RepID=A0A1H0XY43_9MICO|nr:nucleotide exchange factor GrpE [Leucobacter chromiiresistens]SDQ07755.1 molecular chaperone GrpE [Leucobacter chromiiresistens]
MANEEQRTPGEDPNADEVPAQEPESQDSGSAPQPDLTVEDILEAEQSDAAADADSADAGASADADNPYLDDLRRLTAEYANYRKRTEANAAIEKQRAIAAAVSPMLTVLDDLDRAEKHGDLAEGSAFATIAQKIRGTFERIGVQSFGETGEVFDPQIHEAIAQVPVPGTEQQTVLDVIERGYRIGEVELRPAKVAVAVGADG